MSESDEEQDLESPVEYLDDPLFDPHQGGLVEDGLLGVSIAEGQRFPTLEEAMHHVQRFAVANNFSVCKASAKRLDKSSDLVQRQVRTWKRASIRCACSRGGWLMPVCAPGETRTRAEPDRAGTCMGVECGVIFFFRRRREHLLLGGWRAGRPACQWLTTHAGGGGWWMGVRARVCR